MSDIMVSTMCLVYNHEKYLQDALDGFVMQKTNFPVEYVIHDDASTDHSADIIKGYVQKFPKLIRPIYQTENQYSKGVWMTKVICRIVRENTLQSVKGTITGHVIQNYSVKWIFWKAILTM